MEGRLYFEVLPDISIEGLEESAKTSHPDPDLNLGTSSGKPSYLPIQQ